jgi:hypothetical protein
MGRQIAVQPPPQIRYLSKNWEGIVDAPQPNTPNENWLSVARNIWLRDAELAGTIADGRPGFRVLGGQLGDSGRRVGQTLLRWVQQSNATARTVAMVGGIVSTLDWTTETWTTELDDSDFTGAGVTRSTSARTYAVPFGDKLIFSDGINRPWTWDGTSHGGIAVISACPVLFGRPWVYYKKFFGIKATERSTITWSEEADETTGYESGGFNNAWTVAQTSQDPLVAGWPFNDYMLLFRNRSITAITGRVTTDFEATGTRESVSEDLGTSSPAAVWSAGDFAYFVGSDRKLYRTSRGAAPEEVAKGSRNAVHGTLATALDRAIVAPWTVGYAVVFALVDQGAEGPSRCVLVDTRTGECSGIWDGWQMTELAQLVDDEGTLVMAHVGGLTADSASDGYAFVHGTPDGALWDDFGAGNTAIRHEAGVTLGWDTTFVKRFDRVDTTWLLSTDLSNVLVSATTPQDELSAVNGGSLVGTAGGRYDESLYDEALYAGDPVEGKLAVGLANEGRWQQLRFTHHELGERFRLTGIAQLAFALDTRAGAP